MQLAANDPDVVTCACVSSPNQHCERCFQCTVFCHRGWRAQLLSADVFFRLFFASKVLTGDSRLRNCVDHRHTVGLCVLCVSFWDFFRQLTPDMLSVRSCIKCNCGENVVTADFQHSTQPVGWRWVFAVRVFRFSPQLNSMRATFRGDIVAALLPPSISCVPDISRVPTFAVTIAC